MLGVARNAAHSLALRLARELWRWSDRLNRWAVRLFVAGGR